MKQSELPEQLQEKIASTVNAKGFKLRKVSEEEAEQIRGLRAWKNGLLHYRRQCSGGFADPPVRTKCDLSDLTVSPTLEKIRYPADPGQGWL